MTFFFLGEKNVKRHPDFNKINPNQTGSNLTQSKGQPLGYGVPFAK